MALPIKRDKEIVSVLFITDNQFDVACGFLEYMELEDGTYMNVSDYGKFIHIKISGLDITIASSEVDISSIEGYEYNHIFVETGCGFGGYGAYDRLFQMIDGENSLDFKFVRCGVYIVNSEQVYDVCSDLMQEFNFDEDCYNSDDWSYYDWYEDCCVNSFPTQIEVDFDRESYEDNSRYEEERKNFIEEFGEDVWIEKAKLEYRVLSGQSTKEEADLYFAELNER